MKAKRVWGLVLALGLCAGVAGCGSQKATTEDAAQTEQTEQTYPIIGVQAEGAYDILLKNSLGQDITGIAIKTSDETEFPANMMPSDMVLKNGEIAECFYLPESSTEEAEETEETQTAGETDVLLNPTYQVQITCEGDMVYELSALGLDDIEKEVELCKEDDIVFVKYTSKASGDAVSTKEQEAAAQAQQDATQPQEETPAEQTTEQPAQQAEQAPAEQPVQQPAQQPVQAAPEPAAQPVQQPTQQPAQSAPVEQVPEQTTEGCLTEGGGPVFN